MGRSLAIFLQVIQFVLLVGYMVLYRTKVKIPYVKNAETAVIGLLIVGFASCCVGFALNIGHFSWANVWMILAAIIGACLLFVFVTFIFKVGNISYENYDRLLNILFIAMLAKWLIATIHHCR